MAKRVQRVGHDTSTASVFTGLEREITVDLGKKSIRVHDGLVPGGVIVAKEDLSTTPAAIGGSNDGKMTSAQATELANSTAKDIVQDGRLDAVDVLNTAQDALNTTQDGRLTATELEAGANTTLNGTQDTRLDAIELLNTNQDGRLDGMDTLNASQDNSIASTVLATNGNITRLNAMDTKNSQQDISISSLISADSSHVVRLDAMDILNTSQDATLALKAPIANPVFTGNPSAPTPAANDNDTSIATTAFVQTEIAPKAALASPTFTGTPRAPTQGGSNNTTLIATTAFVQNEITPTVVAGYVASSFDYDTLGGIANSFDVLGNIGSTFESVGPTGSGATNIWTSLDILPSNAKKIKLFVNLGMQETTQASIFGLVFSRVTGTNSAGYSIARIKTTGTPTELKVDETTKIVTIAIDSSRRFDLSITLVQGSIDYSSIALLGFSV